MTGRKVNIGPNGSGSQLNALQVLSAHGIEEHQVEPSRLHLKDAFKELREKKIEAIIFTGSYPFKPLESFAKETAIRFLPLEGEAKGKLNASNRVSLSIAKNTYQGQSRDYETIGTTAVLFTSKSTPSSMVKKLISSLFEKQTILASKYAKAGNFSKTNARKGVFIPLHPAASDYLEGER